VERERRSRRAGPRGSQGERTRQEILSVAVDIASAEGLEGLTIGRLANELGMSKSGLFAHFGSKEDLQLATVDTARGIFITEVVDPALAAAQGLPRLRTMLDAWLSYVRRSVFRGGCFFAAASAEFDGRPGAIRDQVALLTRSWLTALEDEARYAQALGQLAPKLEAAQLAFELHALVQEANWAYQLLGDEQAFSRAREGIRARLEAAVTSNGRRMLAAAGSDLLGTTGPDDISGGEVATEEADP
jgi:AcrR family transcriptional regulator